MYFDAFHALFYVEFYVACMNDSSSSNVAGNK